MEPTSIYNNSKRNLAIVVGLLALATVGGIEIREAADNLPFPVKITNPGLLQHVLFVICLYCLYQFWLSWRYQRDEFRAYSLHEVYVTASLSSLAILIYLYKNLSPYLVAVYSNPTGQFALGVIPGIVAGIAANLTFRFADISKWRRDIFSIRRETVDQRLLKQGWILNYNPQLAGRSKRISFNSDHTIGEGQNENENRWQLELGVLSLFRSDGTIQNRFRYDDKTDRFICLNDKDAKGIRDQIIFREAPTQ